MKQGGSLLANLWKWLNSLIFLNHLLYILKSYCTFLDFINYRKILMTTHSREPLQCCLSWRKVCPGQYFSIQALGIGKGTSCRQIEEWWGKPSCQRLLSSRPSWYDQSTVARMICGVAVMAEQWISFEPIRAPSLIFSQMKMINIIIFLFF